MGRVPVRSKMRAAVRVTLRITGMFWKEPVSSMMRMEQEMGVRTAPAKREAMPRRMHHEAYSRGNPRKDTANLAKMAPAMAPKAIMGRNMPPGLPAPKQNMVKMYLAAKSSTRKEMLKFSTKSPSTIFSPPLRTAGNRKAKIPAEKRGKRQREEKNCPRRSGKKSVRG